MNMPITKFTVDDVSDIKQYYQSQGYVVLRNLLKHEKIDNLIKQYEKIKRSKFFIYYSQSVHRPLRPRINSEGLLEESIERPSHLKFFPDFSRAVLDCLVDREISDVLSILSGSSSHSLWLNMFFDKSPGTVEHQDHYYLDTDPQKKRELKHLL